MSIDFTAIDFETANAYQGSPCSVGLAKVRDGRIVHIQHWLIRPPRAHGHFAAFNVGLHGIDERAVRDQPTWEQRLPQIVDYIGGDLVVAHNAAFDVGVIRYACAADALPWPALDFLCTLAVSRRAYRLVSYRLPFVAHAAGAALKQHHHAGDDAVAAAQIAVALARSYGVDSLAELALCLRVGMGHMEAGFYQASAWRDSPRRLVAPDANPDADPDGALYGRTVVFTGTLMSMTRRLAWEEVARAGGKPEKGVTKHTHVLVVGDINPVVLAPGATVTGRAAKAFQLADQGQDIELFTEDDFVRALEPGQMTDRFDLSLLVEQDGAGLSDARDDGPFYAALNHPAGRATKGEPCVKCGSSVARGAYWLYKDRHVCSDRCNTNLKRQYKRWLTTGGTAFFVPRRSE